MDSKKILRLSEILLKLAMGIGIVIYAVYLFVYVHSLVSPDAYEKLLVKPTSSGYEFNYRVNITEQATTKEGWEAQVSDQYFYFNKLTVESKTRILIWFSICLTLSVLCFNCLLSFFKNIKSYSYFFTSNSQSLKKLGYLLLIGSAAQFLFMVMGQDLSMELPGNHYVSKAVHFLDLSTVLFGVIAFFVCIFLSSVFKEGETLRKENELTV